MIKAIKSDRLLKELEKLDYEELFNLTIALSMVLIDSASTKKTKAWSQRTMAILTGAIEKEAKKNKLV